MLSNLLLTLPIFGLILTGWIARRSGALGPNATREVNRVVVYLALPALLFDIMAKADPRDVWQPGFIAAFGGGAGLVFAATLWVRRRQGAALADAAIDGLNTSYANTGFIGFPLLLAVLGPTAMGPALIATILTVCLLFAVAIVLIEIGLQTETRPLTITRKVTLTLARNPLLIAPLLGAGFMVSGVALPQPLDRYLSLLGAAASPCALIALGLFLADTAGRRPRSGPGVQGVLVALKLVAHPAVTWILAGPILGLPPSFVLTATLLAALPTGTGPFMLAEFYGREALLTGRVVLISTLASVVTLSLILSMQG